MLLLRIGGEDFNRANLIALKEGRSLQTSSRDLGEGDSAVTNITRDICRAPAKNR